MEQGYNEVIFRYPKDLYINVKLNKWDYMDRFPSHWHPRLEIIIIEEGSLNVICNGNIFEAKAGEVVFINPNQLHSGKAGAQGVKIQVITTEYGCFVSGKQDRCDKQITLLQNNTVLIKNHIEDREIYNMLMDVIRSEEEKEEYYELLMRGYLTAAIAKIAGRYSFQNEEQNTKPSSEDGNMISQILLYVTEHYQEEITPRVLSEHFGFSLSYFCRYFKQKTGETLTDYINSYRINASRYFLLDTKHFYSVEEIAGLVGYTNATYFYKKFKEVMGQTPLQYRKEWKKYSS